MKKIPRLGDTLVLEGLIDKKQHEKSLSVQHTHPMKSIGEIISKLYNIPEGKIEAIFVKNILVPSIHNHLYSELGKKINNPDFDLVKIVPAIDIQIKTYKRITIASKTFSYANDLMFEPSTDKIFLSKIDCVVESIVMHTAYDESIQFQHILLEFDIPSQKITLENPAIIMEAKIKLTQVLKKREMAGI